MEIVKQILPTIASLVIPAIVGGLIGYLVATFRAVFERRQNAYVEIVEATIEFLHKNPAELSKEERKDKESHFNHAISLSLTYADANVVRSLEEVIKYWKSTNDLIKGGQSADDVKNRFYNLLRDFIFEIRKGVLGPLKQDDLERQDITHFYFKA